MIIFLAYDGVLRSVVADAPRQLNGQLVANFGAVLRRFGQVRVVLSTSWRLQQSSADLLQWFHRDLQGRFIGRTPDLGADGEFLRHREVLRWLERNGGLRQAWVALDADATRYATHCPELFVCEPVRGLDATAADAFRAHLVARTLEHMGQRART